jgi:4'-phosphopantetheinyl transferase EntD
MLRPYALSQIVSTCVSVGTSLIGELDEHASCVTELAGLDPSATAKRRDDFTLGRLAARRALGGLGVHPPSIPIGAQRQPVWPIGVVGSISHSAGVGVAVAARSEDLRGIGVDVEARDRVLSTQVARRILTQAEQWALDEPADVPWPLILFCAKEATYKAIFQAHGLRFGPQDGTFAQMSRGALIGSLSYDNEIPCRSVCARYELTDHFVITCVELAHDPSEEK